MTYLYGDIHDAKPGDVLEYICGSDRPNSAGFIKGKLYIVESYKGNSRHIYVTSQDATDNRPNNFKLVQTKPGSEAKEGDEVISIDNAQGAPSRSHGSVHTVMQVYENTMVEYKEGFSTNPENFRVLLKEDAERQYAKALANNTQNFKPSPVPPVGSTFKVTRDGAFKTGDIAKLIDNAGSSCPKFNVDTCEAYEYWRCMTPFTVESTTSQPIADVKFNSKSNDDLVDAMSNQTYVYNHMLKQTQGNKMNPDIKIEIGGKEVGMRSTEIAEPKPKKTDLQKEVAKPYMAKIFTEAGKYKSKLNAKSVKALDVLIAKHLKHNSFDIVKSYKTIETTTTKAQPLVKTKQK